MAIDSTWGGNAANAYVSYTEADSYVTTAVYDSAAWTDATSAQRNAAILEATVMIDRLTYVGERYYADQRLAFPRGLDRYDPYPYTRVGTPDSILQQQMKDDVQRANALQALHICRLGGRDTHAERIASGIKAFSEKVGPVSEYVAYGGGQGGSAATPQRLSQDVLDLLAKWRTSRQIRRA